MESNDGAVAKFETWDTCSLKSNPFLIGIVERTALDFNTHEPLDDLLIIAHVSVEETILRRFLETGVPEKGYVFVAWADETSGRSLVPESELNLIARTLTLGDTVKRRAEDAMVGTIVSVSEAYTLQPICTRTSQGQPRIQEQLLLHDETLDRPFQRVPPLEDGGQCHGKCKHALPPGLSHSTPHILLYDIPGHEIKRAEDFAEGDHIIHQDWLGQVQDTVPDVTLLLQDGSVVIVDDANEVELLVTDSGKPLVALPEPDGFKKPDILSWNQGLATIAPASLHRGQHVVTNTRNLRYGRWLSGSPHNSGPSQGIVLDVRTRIMDVKWVAPSVRAASNLGSKVDPPVAIRPYENLPTFISPRELRQKKGIVIYDRGRLPTNPNDIKSNPPVMTCEEIQVGDHVKFRDAPQASDKYRDQNAKHGKFDRIPREVAFGFDMNEFKVVYCKRTVTVKWQDETITQDVSTSLIPYMAPENEICPGDLVALKDEMQQVSSTNPSAEGSAYNEIQYLQGGYDLRLGKVGVVQSVDAMERLARVRWFTDARIELLRAGSVLKTGSRLGPISDSIEEVSLYEVMTHQALWRRRGELVLVPGAVEPTPESLTKSMTWPTQINNAVIPFFHPFHMGSVVEYLKGLQDPIMMNIIQPIPSKPRNQNHRSPEPHSKGEDWIGEIIDIGLDGLITVRLGALSECREIRIPLHWILMVVESPPYGTTAETGWSSVSDGSDYESDESEAIEEEIEYEGGERLDDDSGNEMWLTDESGSEIGSGSDSDDDQDMDFDEAMEVDDPDLLLKTINSGSTTPKISSPPSETTASPLFHIATEITSAPAQFDVLESAPPADHFFLSHHTEISLGILRRIRKEHKILLSSLPPNIYVRTFESRLDLFRCMILGPENTPYEHAPFVIDLSIPPNFPNVPPKAHFHSWTFGLGRVNPNLYEEGKICLSLLGTWHGKDDENWSEKATLLQLLVSLTGLVLVKNPFFNEAGFDTLQGQGEYGTEARLYTEKAFVMARGFVKYALTRGVQGMDDILAWNYLPSKQLLTMSTEKQKGRPNLLSLIISRADGLIRHAKSEEASTDSEKLVDAAGNPSNDAFLARLSRGAVVMLQKHVSALGKILRDAEASGIEVNDNEGMKIS